jgi:peptidase M28-like protein
MNAVWCRTQWLVATVGTCVVAAAVSVAGQQTTRYRAPVYPEDAYIRMPLPASERAYADIDGSRIKEWVKEVVGISHRSRDAGDVMWGRIPGTRSEAWTNDWVEEKFRSLGLKDIRRQPFDIPRQWTPISWEFSVLAGGAAHTFQTVRPAMGSGATPAGGVELAATWVGLGSAADFLGRDVRGKAVFILNEIGESAMAQSADWSGATKRAQAAGAAAVILVYGTTGNMSAWGPLNAGVDTLPGFTIGYEDGVAVRDLIGTGKPVSVRIRSDVKWVSGLKSTSVWGSLPGATDENVIVMAHQDAYFDGALDNASGMAVMLALAQHFSKVPQAQRRRTIQFVGTAGHHVGSPNGKWLHEHRETALAKTALMINCEHISITESYIFRDEKQRANTASALRYYLNGSSRLSDIVFGAFRIFGVATFPDAGNGQGEMYAARNDAPSLQLLRSPDDKHSDQDTVDWVPAAGLEAVTRAYAKIIDGVNMVDRTELVPPATTTSR